MNISKWSWGIFAGVLLSLAAGGVWYLYQEGDLAAPMAVEDLPVRPVPHWEDAPEWLAETAVADGDLFAPFAWPEGVVPGDLVFSFKTRTDLEDFLRDARRAGLTELETIPELNLVRVRTRGDNDVRRALGLAGDAGLALNPFVASPEVPLDESFAGRHLPFGDRALEWMGVPEDNSRWGEGVRIAILDTGVGYHPSLEGASITRMSMLGDGAEVGTHGTAVASLLVGQGEIRGIVPAADILSIQVLGADGSGTGFDLARGIIAAVDGGAQAINLSLGTPTPSDPLWLAVQYAQERGVLLVAASGNNGGGQSLYPAAYPDVLSVGGMDANGQHVWFSNRDANLSFVAPGYGLLVAGPDGGVMVMDGTSFAAPLVTGSGAQISKDVSMTQVPVVLQSVANDSGAPGHDGIYGYGAPDMQRWEWTNQPGIYDVAVPGHSVDYSRGYPEMVVSVQNQGTEAVGGIVLEVDINGRHHKLPIGTLGKGEVASGRIPLTDFFARDEAVRVVSIVSAPGIVDVRPKNNAKESVLFLKTP